MVHVLAKRLAASLPPWSQQELKRLRFAGQLIGGRFRSDEPEFAMLGELISEGDWVLDVGANVGHYTRKLSELTGSTGRVIAFEPVPETFELLAANARFFPHSNVTLLNVAASEVACESPMDVPLWQTRLPNNYRARLSGSGRLAVLCITIDEICLTKRISLVKIDVEGHEISVLKGMKQLLQRDRPALIIETDTHDAAALLAPLGYTKLRIPGSPNEVYRSI